MGYSVEILNDYTAPLRVEIRTGDNATEYTKNQCFYEGKLEGGHSKNPDNDDPLICYRRSADPDNPASEMAGWHTYSPNNDNTPVQLLLSEAG